MSRTESPDLLIFNIRLYHIRIAPQFCGGVSINRTKKCLYMLIIFQIAIIMPRWAEPRGIQ